MENLERGTWGFLGKSQSCERQISHQQEKGVLFPLVSPGLMVLSTAAFMNE